MGGVIFLLILYHKSLKTKIMKTVIRILLMFVLFAGAFSCTNEDDWIFSNENDHIKSISSYGQTTQMFLYDNLGRIREKQGMLFYNRYLYDENGRLEKVETAIDESMYSSLATPPRTELLTSANSTINSYNLYKYDNEGRLSKIENYINRTGKKFEYGSKTTFEYAGTLICKANLCDEKGNITQFLEYTYDQNGNITKEMYYTCIFGATLSNPKLTYERTYQYDNYNNPLHILNMLEPKFYTSANNMIEMTTKWYTNDPRTETTKQSFKYNDKGYPIKMTYDGGVEEYTY